jgi:hypothetical protein
MTQQKFTDDKKEYFLNELKQRLMRSDVQGVVCFVNREDHLDLLVEGRFQESDGFNIALKTIEIAAEREGISALQLVGELCLYIQHNSSKKDINEEVQRRAPEIARIIQKITGSDSDDPLSDMH